MKKLFLATVGLVALAGPSLAADLAAKYPVKAPVVVVPEFSWTGFYIGANLGGGWSDGSGSATILPYGTGMMSGSGSGFIYGGQIGYNYEVNSWVFGVETDLQGYVSSNGSFGGIAGSTWYGSDSDVDYFGTIRGRVGYAWDRLLVYGTAGAAYGKASISGDIGGIPYDESSTYWTWTAGAGVEYAFTDNWTVKGEYLYLGTPNDVPEIAGTADVDGHVNSNVLRVGVNYKF